MNFNDTVEGVVLEGASDIHIKIAQPVVYRVAGILYRYDGPKISREDLRSIVDEIVPEESMELLKKQRALDFAWTHPEVGRFRVNVFMSNGEPAIAMRHVKDNVPEFADLHLPEILGKLALSRAGIIILTGSTGSGKSTTLASMIEYINTLEFQRIITIEDPIEYMFSDRLSVISQKEVGLDTLTFLDGLKYALRQDPDTIMIGELRDSDSFGSCLKAAETGHLIFTTLHADTPAQAIPRILDFYPSEEQNSVRKELATNIQAVIGQRLIPDVYGKARPAVEIMINTPTVKKLIMDDDLNKLSMAIEGGVDDGMQSFDQSLLKLIQDGHISTQVGLEYATNADNIRMNLKGIFLNKGGGIIGS